MGQPARRLDPVHRLTSMVVIPARLASTRLPQKLLLRETGRSLLEHTYRGTRRAKRPLGVCVAADDELLVADVRRFDGQVQLTRKDHASGTDRVAEVAARMPDVDIVVNVQGDEPEISGELIDQCVELLERTPEAEMATLCAPLRCLSLLNDPACVKVVFDQDGLALYFSRSPIPHVRDWDPAMLHHQPPLFHQHIGIYAYRRDFLLRFHELPPSDLEQTEKLEQLRALSAGIKIAIGVVDDPTRGNRHAGRLSGVCRTIPQSLR